MWIRQSNLKTIGRAFNQTRKAFIAAIATIASVAVALGIDTPAELNEQWVSLMWSGLGAWAATFGVPNK